MNKKDPGPVEVPALLGMSLGVRPREPPDTPEDQRPHRSDADHPCEQRPQDDEVTLAVVCGGELELGTPGWGLAREQGKEAQRLA